jgi:6-pyruvoyltetrahydropterin/6-carboxytetrahydropterin synthase
MGREPNEYPEVTPPRKRVGIIREYDCESAHWLTGGIPEGHKCRTLHGHCYHIEIKISGFLDADGMLVEYGDLDKIVRPIWLLADHQCINGINTRCSTPEAVALSQNPTVERLVLWLTQRLQLLASAKQEQSMRLESVTIREDPRSRAVWQREWI